jgi:hypothetical protein
VLEPPSVPPAQALALADRVVPGAVASTEKEAALLREAADEIRLLREKLGG